MSDRFPKTHEQATKIIETLDRIEKETSGTQTALLLQVASLRLDVVKVLAQLEADEADDD